MSLHITNSIFQLHLPGTNELNLKDMGKLAVITTKQNKAWPVSIIHGMYCMCVYLRSHLKSVVFRSCIGISCSMVGVLQRGLPVTMLRFFSHSDSQPRWQLQANGFDSRFLSTENNWLNEDWSNNMMTSWHANAFWVTSPLCGESTNHKWIPPQRASDAFGLCFKSRRAV